MIYPPHAMRNTSHNFHRLSFPVDLSACGRGLIPLCVGAGLPLPTLVIIRFITLLFHCNDCHRKRGERDGGHHRGEERVRVRRCGFV
jgi:hypothetical protein